MHQILLRTLQETPVPAGHPGRTPLLLRGFRIIYKSPDLLKHPFTKLYDKPVISDVSNARMAGHFIQRDNDIIRVSQNCGKRYGYKANFNRIIQIEDGYQEELIDTIKPAQGALGFHTYNQAQDIIVGDMEIPRFDWYSLKRFVGGNLGRLFEIGRDAVFRNKDK